MRKTTVMASLVLLAAVTAPPHAMALSLYVDQPGFALRAGPPAVYVPAPPPVFYGPPAYYWRPGKHHGKHWKKHWRKHHWRHHRGWDDDWDDDD